MANNKKTDDMKIFVWFAIIFIIFISTITVAATIPYNQRKAEFYDEPEQISQAEVMETQSYLSGRRRSSSRHYRAYFKLSNGTEKEFIIDYTIYKNIQQGETGILYYKDLPKDTMDFKSFIRFKKDVEQNSLPLEVEGAKQPSLFRVYVTVAIPSIFTLGIIWILIKAKAKVKSEKTNRIIIVCV